MATHGRDWRQHEDVELPSGKTATLRKPDVLSLITGGGDVPDVLTRIVMQGVKGKTFDSKDLTAGDLPGLADTLNTVARACFVSPRAVPDAEALALEQSDPDGDWVAVSDIDYMDKLFVFNWAMGGQGEAARRFPGGQRRAGKGVADVQPGEDLPADAGGDAGAE